MLGSSHADKPARAAFSRRAWLRLAWAALTASASQALVAACAPLHSPVVTPYANPTAMPTPSPVPATSTSATAGPVVLQFWTQWADETRQAWEALMAEFQRVHPAIHVATSFFPLADLIRNSYKAAATNALPDLWINAAMVPPEFILDGIVASLSSLGPVPTDFYPASDPASVRFGQRWAVPNNGGVPVLWYNAGLFQVAGLDPKQPPQTWDDLKRYGKELTNYQRGTWGLIVPNRHYPWTAQCWYSFLLAAGGDIFAPNQQTLTFNDPSGIEALTLWTELFQTAKTAPLEIFDADTLLSTYSSGTIGMFPMYSVELEHIKSFSVSTRNVPLPKDQRRGAHFAGDYTTIAATSGHKSEAFTWCTWWWQPEINARWCAQTGGIPSRPASAADPVYQSFLQKAPLVQASLDSLPYAKALPSVPGISEIEQRLSEAIYDACFGYKTPKQALDDAIPAVHASIAARHFLGDWRQG